MIEEAVELARGCAKIVAEGSASAVVETAKGVTVAFAAASTLQRPGGIHTFFDSRRWELEVEVGRTYRLDRIFAIYTSREVSDPITTARRHVEAVLESSGAAGVVKAHVAAWRDVWRASDVRVEGDEEAQRALGWEVEHELLRRTAADRDPLAHDLARHHAPDAVDRAVRDALVRARHEALREPLGKYNRAN